VIDYRKEPIQTVRRNHCSGCKKNKKNSVRIILKKMRMDADQAEYAERTYDQYANLDFDPSPTGIKTVLESLSRKKTQKPKARIRAPLCTRVF
jgi:hypothetical protein